ncbi:MAG TPA: methyltransferase domain-containing protein [Candidatus Bathyarchaeia archaeon]|nr:methyltransferase domain-containing protein [Candidatus Bathyarchaeia archaeon]
MPLYGIDKQLRFQYSAAMLQDRSMVLDVGGGRGDFLDFASCSGVIADLPPHNSLFGRTKIAHSAVYFDGVRLPFRDKSFKTVVSLDTLEHVSKEKRPSFIRELQRVSANRIILTFPERQFFLEALEVTARLYDGLGISRVMRKSLEEHRRFGLPSSAEVLKQIDLNDWAARIITFMGRWATGFWIMQLFLPFLATPIVNNAIANSLSQVSKDEASECLMVLQRIEKAETTDCE